MGNRSLNVDCVGIILFNFAFIVTIPSWYNEKSANASVIKSLLYSIAFVACLFVAIGVFGAMSFKYSDLSGDNQSLFTVIDDFGGTIGKVSVYLYPIIQNITSIPVFCIIIRYNLQNSGLSKYISNFISPPYLYLLSIQMNATMTHFDKRAMLPLSAIDTDDEEEDDSEKGKEKTVVDVDDDEVTEDVQLIEMNQQRVDDAMDVDITKKNEIKCTWDVIVAIICILASVILSLVVIIEKLYIMTTVDS